MFDFNGNPLNSLVRQVVEAGQYFTKDHYDQLRPLLEKVAPLELSQAEAFSRDSDSLNSTSIATLLSKQVALYNRLQAVANSSDSVKELKDVMSASQALIQQISKLKDTVTSEETLGILEDCIAEALNDLGDEEIKQRFFSLFKERVESKKKESRQ